MAEQEISFNQQYELSDVIMLRVPVFSLHVLEEIGIGDGGSLLRQYLKNPVFREAIFLASPELLERCEKWESGLLKEEVADRVKRSLMKYLIRMSVRCTPFGLFAGIGTGHFGAVGKVEISIRHPHELFIRPDMLFLGSLAEKLKADPGLRSSMDYFPNNSLGLIGDNWRYVEYHYNEHNLRIYHLQSTSNNEALEMVLEDARQGSSMAELTAKLIEAGIGEAEAVEYIHTLIDNQLLVPDIEPRVSGEPYFEELLERYGHFDNVCPAVAALKLVGKGISDISKAETQGGSRLEAFRAASGESVEIQGGGRREGLFQVDVKTNFVRATLPEVVREDLAGIIPVLMKLSRRRGNPMLEKFGKQLETRYGANEVPLALALDAELGPGYAVTAHDMGIDPLLEGLALSSSNDLEARLMWDDIDSYLYRKLQEALVASSPVIRLTEAELQQLPSTDKNYPLSFSVLARVLGPAPPGDLQRYIHIVSAGGSSALNLAGRFAYMEKALLNELKDIAKREQALFQDTLIAEIVHLPQQRTGNILMRPVFREYEIPYLARPSVDSSHQLPLNDLMVSVREGKILLRSKRLNKYILPKLSNAHNYSLGALPVYKFLCDLQTQSVNANLSFSWGLPEQENSWLPRVMYKNIILEPANWTIQGGDLQDLNSAGSLSRFSREIRRWQHRYSMPDEVILSMGDNELWIDLRNDFLLSLLQAESKTAGKIVLKEYLGQGSQALVTSNGKAYANECLFFVKPTVKQ